MATGLSESEKNLIKSVRELGLNPSADTPDDLKQWLKRYHDEDEETFDDDDDNAAVEGAKTLRLANAPKLSTFYGDVDKLTKGEVVYDQWHYEVQSMLEENYKERQIQQAIRRSLKGNAAKVLKRLPIGTSVEDILKKFESVYGSADSRATILRNFYSAEQQPGENVRDWSCRLEELLDKAISNGLITQSENVQSMLCDKFWSGLLPELRDITGHKYDSIVDFDELRTEVKKIEYEHNRTDKKPVTTTAKSAINSQQKDSTKAELDELRGMIKDVASSVENMGQEIQNLTTTINSQQPVRNYGYKRQSDNRSTQQQYNNRHGQQSSYSRGQQSYQAPHNNKGQNRSQNRTEGQDRYSSGHDKHYQQERGNSQQTFRDERGTTGTRYDYERNNRSRREYNYDDGPICYRCGQRGHIQRYCRVRTDHLHRLN